MKTHREAIYERYTETTYAARNDLSPEGLAASANFYRSHFGPLLPDDRRAKILEVGCGSGALLLAMRDLGYGNLSAIDIAPGQVEFCRSMGFEDIQQADVLKFFDDRIEYWDAIVLADVLEHLEKDEVFQVLGEIREHLNPDGIVILRVPNMSNPLNIRTRYVDFTHEVGFSKETLEQVLRVAGFDVLTIKGEFSPHRRLAARLLFDRFLWWAFRMFCRHTLYLHQDVIRGKNLLASARIAR